MARPECIKDEYLAYLESLKAVSVSDAHISLLREFGINADTAHIVVAYWIHCSGHDKSVIVSGCA